MSTGNGDLTRAERMALRPGARVAWQGGRALMASLGVVDQVSETTGAVILCDGTWVTLSDRLVLVAAEPGRFPADSRLAPEDQEFRSRLDEAAERLEGRKRGTDTTDETDTTDPTDGTDGTDSTDEGKGRDEARRGATGRRRAAPRVTGRKVCEDCGRGFVPVSNGQRRCMDCAGKVRLRVEAARRVRRAAEIAAEMEAWRRLVASVARLMAPPSKWTKRQACEEVARRRAQAGIVGGPRVTAHAYGFWSREIARADAARAANGPGNAQDGAGAAGPVVGRAEGKMAGTDQTDETDETDQTDKTDRADGGDELAAARAALRAAEDEVARLKGALREAVWADGYQEGAQRLLAAGSERLSGLEAEQVEVSRAVATVHEFGHAVGVLRRLLDGKGGAA